MHLKIKQVTIVGLSMVILLAGGFFVYATFFSVDTDLFQGTVSSESINCVVSDQVERISVDGKDITVGLASTQGDEKIGTSLYYSCGDLDYTGMNNSNGFDMPDSGSANGGEELVGREVEVYARRISESKYTLVGSEQYYVRFKD
ncbi:MAG: hypothetical protein EOO17_03485 [Chloroflexi bacterium]|nr:MAG: hypothetical protein EOO17_03485 [Chloroflexota bacterium]